MRFEHVELVRCAEREVEMRRRVYRDRVSRGAMTRERAADEIAKMEAIAEFLRAHAPAPVPPAQGGLFDDSR